MQLAADLAQSAWILFFQIINHFSVDHLRLIKIMTKIYTRHCSKYHVVGEQEINAISVKVYCCVD
jgi:hypothetical protein